MIRKWIRGKELIERWQINPLDLVEIVLSKRMHVYESDGRPAKFKYEDAIRQNHPRIFLRPDQKKSPKDARSIYDLIINNEFYDYELPQIPIPPDYIPLALRIDDYWFLLLEVKFIEKELNILPNDNNNEEYDNNITQINVGITSTSEINMKVVKESGIINDQLIEKSGEALFEEKPEPRNTPIELRTEENLFQNQGEFWKIIYRGEQLQPFKDAKGFRYLAILLQNPGQSLHVTELVRLVNDPEIPIKESYSRLSRERLSEEDLNLSDFGDAGQVIDARTLSEYKKEIRDLEEDIDEAENNNDFARLEMLRAEKEFLQQHISAATDLNGRIRKLDDRSDRARKAVYASIQSSIEKILKKHPELGQHLDNSIKTGRFCSYLPDKPISWAI